MHILTETNFNTYQKVVLAQQYNNSNRSKKQYIRKKKSNDHINQLPTPPLLSNPQRAEDIHQESIRLKSPS